MVQIQREKPGGWEEIFVRADLQAKGSEQKVRTLVCGHPRRLKCEVSCKALYCDFDWTRLSVIEMDSKMEQHGGPCSDWFAP